MNFRTFLESYDKLGSDIKKGHTIEARGVKGKDKEKWSKSFKDKAELDKWAKENDATVFAHATKKIEEGDVGYSPWEILNSIAENDHGEFGFATLSEDEAATLVNFKAANRIALDVFHLSKNFFNCSERDMKKIINAHPELLKGRAAAKFKKQLK